MWLMPSSGKIGERAAWPKPSSSNLDGKYRMQIRIAFI